MIAYRHATESDAQAIADVYVGTWRSTYAGTLPDRVLIGMKPKKLTISFARALKHHTEIIMVADDPEHGVLAMGSAGGNRDQQSDFKGEVYTLYVHPDFQNMGVGERLMAHLFLELSKSGINSALIWVLALNPSRFFYERMGGKRVGDREEKLWGTTLQELGYGWLDLKNSIHNERPRLTER